MPLGPQTGDEFLVYISDASSPTSDSFVLLGAMENNSIEFAEEPTKTTNKGTSQRWAQHQRFGERMINIDGEGVFEPGAGVDELEEYIRADGNAKREFKIVVPGKGSYQCYFIVSRFKFTGPQKDKVKYDFAAVSDGKPVFTPE